MKEDIAASQSQSNPVQQQHPGKQVDGPDEPVVNEQEQTITVNPQEEKQYDNKEKGYKEGNRNDSDTDKKEPPAKNNNPVAED